MTFIYREGTDKPSTTVFGRYQHDVTYLAVSQTNHIAFARNPGGNMTVTSEGGSSYLSENVSITAHGSYRE
jgi:hypothetical protein